VGPAYTKENLQTCLALGAICFYALKKGKTYLDDTVFCHFKPMLNDFLRFDGEVTNKKLKDNFLNGLQCPSLLAASFLVALERPLLNFTSYQCGEIGVDAVADLILRNCEPISSNTNLALFLSLCKGKVENHPLFRKKGSQSIILNCLSAVDWVKYEWQNP
jgi:hypothetical protein